MMLLLWYRARPRRPSGLLAEDAGLALREAVDHVPRHPEVVHQQRHRIPAQPVGQRNLLILAAVEQNDDLRRLIADLFDVVAVSLVDEAHIARPELVCLVPPVRPEDADPRPPAHEELP